VDEQLQKVQIWNFKAAAHVGDLGINKIVISKGKKLKKIYI
jgi:hypothetical protein